MEIKEDGYSADRVTEDFQSLRVESEYNESVSMLSQMFPNIPMMTINETIRECKGDFDKSCDVLLNHSLITEPLEDDGVSVNQPDQHRINPNEKPSLITAKREKKESQLFPAELETEGNFLKEVFPNIPSAQIIRQLRMDGKDVMKLYDALANYNIINTSSKLYEIRLDLSDQNLKASKPHKTWNQIDEEVSQVCDLTGATKAKARYYYHKSNSVGGAIIMLIEDVSQSMAVNTKSLKPVSGQIVMSSSRVQTNSKPLPKRRTSSSSSSSSFDQTQLLDDYQYDVNGKEAIDLEDCKLKSPSLFLLSDKFYIKLLTFFQGDVERVVSVAEFIISLKAYKNTFLSLLTESRLSKDNKIEKPDVREDDTPMEFIKTENFFLQLLKGLNSSEYVKKSENFSRLAKESSDKSVKGYYASLASQNKAQAHAARIDQEKILLKQKIRESLSTNTLDLHNLSAVVAIETVSKVLGDWWGDEILYREQSGQRRTAGNVQNVEAIRVVTGRGIHSAGGVSKLKVAVKKFLVSNKYHFEEGLSSFTITGKSQL